MSSNASIYNTAELHPPDADGQSRSIAYLHSDDRFLPDLSSGFRLWSTDRGPAPPPSYLYTGEGRLGSFGNELTPAELNLIQLTAERETGYYGVLAVESSKKRFAHLDGVPLSAPPPSFPVVMYGPNGFDPFAMAIYGDMTSDGAGGEGKPAPEDGNTDDRSEIARKPSAYNTRFVKWNEGFNMPVSSTSASVPSTPPARRDAGMEEKERYGSMFSRKTRSDLLDFNLENSAMNVDHSKPRHPLESKESQAILQELVTHSNRFAELSKQRQDAIDADNAKRATALEKAETELKRREDNLRTLQPDVTAIVRQENPAYDSGAMDLVHPPAPVASQVDQINWNNIIDRLNQRPEAGQYMFERERLLAIEAEIARLRDAHTPVVPNDLQTELETEEKQVEILHDQLQQNYASITFGDPDPTTSNLASPGSGSIRSTHDIDMSDAPVTSPSSHVQPTQSTQPADNRRASLDAQTEEYNLPTSYNLERADEIKGDEVPVENRFQAAAEMVSRYTEGPITDINFTAVDNIINLLARDAFKARLNARAVLANQSRAQGRTVVNEGLTLGENEYKDLIRKSIYTMLQNADASHRVMTPDEVKDQLIYDFRTTILRRYREDFLHNSSTILDDLKSNKFTEGLLDHMEISVLLYLTQLLSTSHMFRHSDPSVIDRQAVYTDSNDLLKMFKGFFRYYSPSRRRNLIIYTEEYLKNFFAFLDTRVQREVNTPFDISLEQAVTDRLRAAARTQRSYVRFNQFPSILQTMYEEYQRRIGPQPLEAPSITAETEGVFYGRNARTTGLNAFQRVRTEEDIGGGIDTDYVPPSRRQPVIIRRTAPRSHPESDADMKELTAPPKRKTLHTGPELDFTTVHNTRRRKTAGERGAVQDVVNALDPDQLQQFTADVHRLDAQIRQQFEDGVTNPHIPTTFYDLAGIYHAGLTANDDDEYDNDPVHFHLPPSGVRSEAQARDEAQAAVWESLMRSQTIEHKELPVVQPLDVVARDQDYDASLATSSTYSLNGDAPLRALGAPSVQYQLDSTPTGSSASNFSPDAQLARIQSMRWTPDNERLTYFWGPAIIKDKATLRAQFYQWIGGTAGPNKRAPLGVIPDHVEAFIAWRFNQQDLTISFKEYLQHLYKP